MGVIAQASTVIPERAKVEADIIVGQRICNIGPTTTWNKLAGDGVAKLVFEIDDDLWNVHPRNELAYDFFQGPGVIKRLNACITVSDMVTVTTERLAERVRQFNDNVVVLPNCFDDALLLHQRPKRDALTVGWSGSATHAPDFEEVAPRLKRFFRRNPKVDMHFIGQTYAHLIGKQSRYTKWSMEVSDYYKAIDFDIGIIPLTHDVFNRSKSFVKAMEYAALGIPVVASHYGPYPEFVIHGETGFLAKHDHDWEHYLGLLVHDEDLRNDMGKRAREHAASYTIQTNGHRWLAAYAGLL